jgi:hypothetical protein
MRVWPRVVGHTVGCGEDALEVCEQELTLFSPVVSCFRYDEGNTSG